MAARVFEYLIDELNAPRPKASRQIRLTRSKSIPPGHVLLFFQNLLKISARKWNKNLVACLLGGRAETRRRGLISKPRGSTTTGRRYYAHCINQMRHWFHSNHIYKPLPGTDLILSKLETWKKIASDSTGFRSDLKEKECRYQQHEWCRFGLDPFVAVTVEYTPPLSTAFTTGGYLLWSL